MGCPHSAGGVLESADNLSIGVGASIKFRAGKQFAPHNRFLAFACVVSSFNSFVVSSRLGQKSRGVVTCQETFKIVCRNNESDNLCVTDRKVVEYFLSYTIILLTISTAEFGFSK